MKYDLEEILRNTLQDKRQQQVNPGKNSLENLVAGEFLDAEQQVFCTEVIRELPCSIGGNNLILPATASVIRQWAGVSNTPEPEDYLFLDTETTGLAGGTGTWVFMVGLGYFSGQSFIIRQYFLKELEGESRFLAELQKELEKRKILVTFNGKSYDLNLLKTRFIMNQMEYSQTLKPNIDLLFLGRRLWKSSLENCRLQTLEQEVLAIRRIEEQEIPSSEIPQRYFDFLETGNAFYLAKVFQHNQQDILTLPLLLQYISEVIDNSRVNEKSGSILGIARLLLEQGRASEAEIRLQTATAKEDIQQCRFALTQIYKKRGEFSTAFQIWLEEDEKSLIILEELAKYAEHRLKDLIQAQSWTQQAINKIIASDFSNKGRMLADWQKRRQRIELKMVRNEERQATNKSKRP